MKRLVPFLPVIFLLFAACDDGGPEPDPYCGDGIVNNVSEECDGTVEGDDSCLSLGYYGGTVTCSDSCTLSLSQCEAAGRCGDHVVNEGETEETCCEDTGCSTGICTVDGCVPLWQGDCPLGGQCSAEQPWYCEVDDLPTYDCGECGCGGSGECFSEVCYETWEMDAQRSTYLLPMDKDLDWYFTLIDKIMDPDALTYSEFSAAVQERLIEEERIVAILFGESHGSLDEQNVNMQLMRDLIGNGWFITGMGMENNGSPLLDATQTGQFSMVIDGISGDLSNTSYCNAAVDAIEGMVNYRDGLYFMYTGSGHTSREIARWDMHWGICGFPHTAECVLRESRMALTLIAFDPDIWMTLTDQILMWRVGDFYTSVDAVTTTLDQTVGRWNTSFSTHDYEAAYEADANDASVNVRLVPSDVNDDVWFAFFPRPGRQPWLTMGFRTLWQDTDIRDYLWAHQIKPGNCSVSWNFTPGSEELTYFCGVDAFEVEAHIDGVTFELLTYTLAK